MFDGKPEDRNQFAVYILDIEIDHKPDGKGGLMAYERIILGKKGAPNWQSELDVKRLEKDNPALYQHLLPTIDGWRKTQTITTEGQPLEAWPTLTKGQLKALKNIGLRSVEDVRDATDSIREKFGMGFMELRKAAKAFLENKAKAAVAKQLTDQDDAIDDLKKQLQEAQDTIRQLAAKAGMAEQKPNLAKREAA